MAPQYKWEAEASGKSCQVKKVYYKKQNCLALLNYKAFQKYPFFKRISFLWGTFLLPWIFFIINDILDFM